MLIRNFCLTKRQEVRNVAELSAQEQTDLYLGLV